MRVIDYHVSSAVAAEQPWTADDIGAAARLWNDDKLTASGIADRMGRSRSSVCGMISRNRAHFAPRNGGAGSGATGTGRWTEAMLATARRLHALDVAPRQIAAEIGISLQRLMRVIDNRKDLFPTPRGSKPMPDPATIAAAETREAEARARRRERDLAVRRQLQPVTARAVDYEPGLDALFASGRSRAGDGPCGLMDLTARRCKWPIGDPREAGFHFCGTAIDLGAVYCGCHRSRAVAGVHLKAN